MLDDYYLIRYHQIYSYAKKKFKLFTYKDAAITPFPVRKQFFCSLIVF